MKRGLLDFAPPPDWLTPQENGLLSFHRNNLKTGNYLKDEQGLSSVYIMGIDGPDGRIYNVPGYWDGERHTPQEAGQRAAEIGWDKFPSYGMASGFHFAEPSNIAARRLHGLIDADMLRFGTMSRGYK